MALSSTLVATAYAGRDAWERDVACIIGPQYWAVAHLDQVPNAGDAVTFCIANFTLVIIRQHDGGVRVFHNTCRHRAGPLVWPGESPRGLSQLQCRYHGWCYQIDGALTATPMFGAQPEIKGLIEVSAHVWQGLVFASATGPVEGPVPSVFDALESQFSDLGLGGMQVERQVSHMLACDWKVYVENYLEGYHIPWVHPGLAREVALREYQVEVGFAGQLVRHHVNARTEDAVNAGRWVWAWPGLAVNVYAAGVCIERMVPDGPGRTRVDYLYLFAPEVSADARTRAMEMSSEVTAEDVRIVEAVQRNLTGGVVPQGVLSPRHEAGVAAFHELCRQAWSG
jgi:choline monooxygenase